MNKAIKEKEEKIYLGLKIICCVVIAVAAGWNISKLSSIHVLYDEFGYSASAAYYAGHDWSSVANHSAYYGYGYGMLLSILMRLAQGNMTLYYQMGIMLNILMLIGSFWVSCSVGRRLFPKVSKYVIVVFACLTTFYSNTMCQSNILWTETILYFLFWLSLWFMIRILDRQKISDMLGLSVTAVYMYMVHQRAIVIIIAVLMVMAIRAVISKDKKTGVIILLFIILMIGLDSLLKTDIKQGMWGTGLSNSNDFSGQSSKIVDIFTTWSGFRLFITGVLGKVYYLLSASLLFVGFYAAGVINKIVKKDCTDAYVHTYLALCLAGATAVSAIFMLYGSRQDTLIYGRYTEYVIGPILMLGMLYLWSQEYSKAAFRAILLLTVGTAAVVYVKLARTGWTAYNMICAIGLSQIFDGGHPAGIQPLIGAIISILLCMLMVLFVKRRKQNVYVLVMTGLVPLAFWSYTNYNVMDVIARTSESNAFYEETADSLREYSEDGEIPIYYLTQAADFESRYIEVVQYYLCDIPITYVEDEDKEDYDLSAGILVMDQRCADISGVLSDFQMVQQVGDMYIFVPII
ncbi:MAG: hypothetical protein UHW97_02750 [Frisingicoccus sp.]|nr:hypothetical protein [Frisingicoccus sp.]